MKNMIDLDLIQVIPEMGIFKTEYGELNLVIPRDRNGEFSQQTLPAYKRTNDSLETTIIQLFQKGITMSEISDLSLI